ADRNIVRRLIVAAGGIAHGERAGRNEDQLAAGLRLNDRQRLNLDVGPIVIAAPAAGGQQEDREACQTNGFAHQESYFPFRFLVTSGLLHRESCPWLGSLT